MHSFGRICALVAFGSGIVVATARADEEKIPLDKVPKAVLEAFKGKFPKATIKAALKEVEDGKTTYEIESTLNGLGVDAVLESDGKFVEIEKEIKTADLPAAVTAAIEAKYPKSKIKKAEELIKGDKSVYEVSIETADGKSTEIVLDKDGKVVK